MHMVYSAAGAVKLDSNGAEVNRLESASDERVRVVLVPAGARWVMYDYSEMTA